MKSDVNVGTFSVNVNLVPTNIYDVTMLKSMDKALVFHDLPVPILMMVKPVDQFFLQVIIMKYNPEYFLPETLITSIST